MREDGCEAMRRNCAELTSLQASNGLIFALGFISLGYDRGNGTASCAVAVHSLSHGVLPFVDFWLQVELRFQLR